jgi:FkbM family methyltransferase
MYYFKRALEMLKNYILGAYLFIEYRVYRMSGADSKWFNLKRGRMYLPLSPTVKGNSRRFEVREPYTEKVLRDHAKPGMTVFEIGAAMGEFTLVISKLIGEKGKCYTFEPFPKYVKYLTMNIAENNLKNVIHVNKAVGAKHGEIEFSLDDEASYTGIRSLWKFNPQRNFANTRSTGELLKVPVVPISDYINKENIDVDFLFMDIEGCETLVFEDMLANVPMDKFPEIYFEGHQGLYGQDKLDAMIKEFTDKGFKAEKITRQHYILTPPRM